MEIVEVTMQKETLSQVDKVKDRVDAASRSDAVRIAVETMDLITSAMEKGHKVMIEEKWGRKKELTIK